MRKQVKIMNSLLLKMLLLIHQVTFITKEDSNVKSSHNNQILQSDCNKQLMALFLKDDKTIVLSF